MTRTVLFILVFSLLSCAMACGAPVRRLPVFEQYGGHRGIWLRSAVAEAFVMATPYPRVLAFRTLGGESPLFVATPREFIGVRTWFMRDTEPAEAPLPAELPATFSKISPLSITVTGAVEPKSHMRLYMIVTLDAHKPVMTVKQGMRNCGTRTTPYATWSIAALNRTGELIFPFGPGATPNRTLTYYTGTSMREQCLSYGEKALSVDLSVPVPSIVMKFGVLNKSGWAAWIHHTTALIVQAPYKPRRFYPDGGANITCYNNSDPHGGWAEIENVDAFSTLAPGQTGWMTQTYTLATITPPKNPHNPDAWMEALKSKE
jgi:hypothetical protein